MKALKPIILNKENTISLILIIAVIFFLLYLKSSDQSLREENVGTKLGQYAPDFETEYLNGDKFVLYELRGKPVILNFWATWCPPCIKEMPVFQKLYEENKGELIVIGVNLQEDKETIEKFIKKINVTFPIILDKDGKIEQKYNVILKPSTYFIDKNGLIADKKLGEIKEYDIKSRSRKILNRNGG